MEKLKAAMRRDMTLTILIGLTIAVLLFLAIGLGDKIFNGMSFQSMAFQLSEFAMLSLGMGLVMLLGGIDLGIVANANMLAMMGAFILSDMALRESLGDGLVIVIAIIVSLLVATAAGIINGVLIAKVSVNPIIATLGTMTLYNGIAMAASGGNGVSGFPQDFTLMGTADNGRHTAVVYCVYRNCCRDYLYYGKDRLRQKNLHDRRESYCRTLFRY